jgi:hypothetical protein
VLITSAANPTQVKPLQKRELSRRLKRLGLSYRELARRIGTSDTTVIRVVNRDMKSAPCWRKIHDFLATAEQGSPT